MIDEDDPVADCSTVNHTVTPASIESPRPATVGTGSKPPSKTDVITVSMPPTTRTLARLPPGTVPGNSATYTMPSPADADRTRALPEAATMLRTGSEAMRP